MATTRGDRLFIGLLAAAYLNLASSRISEKMVGWFGLEAGALDLDQLRRLDARARADHAQGLTLVFAKAPADPFPAGVVHVNNGKHHRGDRR